MKEVKFIRVLAKEYQKSLIGEETMQLKLNALSPSRVGFLAQAYLICIWCKKDLWLIFELGFCHQLRSYLLGVVRATSEDQVNYYCCAFGSHFIRVYTTTK